MMQDRLAALSSKYDINLVSNFTYMHYVSLNSHRKMLNYYINNIRRIYHFLSCRVGNQKYYFLTYIFLTGIFQLIINLEAQDLENP